MTDSDRSRSRLAENENLRRELRQSAREVTRQIVRSPEWKRMVAAGEIPDHLVAYAESLQESGKTSNA